MRFTIDDYLRNISNTPMLLEQPEEQYQLSDGQEEVHQYRDKIFRVILDKEKEALLVIERLLKNEKIDNLEEGSIEKYNRKFTTKTLKTKEADVIYKIRDKDIFILIEHQSRQDKKMPRRITEYCMEIMRSVKNKEREPLIYPIVLYTGKAKWKVPLTLEQVDGSKYGMPPLSYPAYNLIDINDYTKEKLIEENTGISKALLFEKLETEEEFEETLNELMKKKLTKDEVDAIVLILLYSNEVRSIIPQLADKFLIKLNREGGDMHMFDKLLREYGQKLARQAEERRIAKVIFEMLKKKFDEKSIMEVTGVSKEELDNLKLQVQ